MPLPSLDSESLLAIACLVMVGMVMGPVPSVDSVSVFVIACLLRPERKRQCNNVINIIYYITVENRNCFGYEKRIGS